MLKTQNPSQILAIVIMNMFQSWQPLTDGVLIMMQFFL